MDDEDSMFGQSLLNECDEQSINFILERLNSKNNENIYETIIQIKNLIIGNNKYKSFYLKDKLVNRLLEILNDYYLNYLVTIINEDQQQQQQEHDQNDHSSRKSNNLMDNNFIDLINQILIIFGSFSLGNLDHVTQLIKVFNLHELLFNLIRLNKIYIELNPCYLKQTSTLKLIESCLRCLSNLYSSSQIIPGLVYSLDKHLYLLEDNSNQLEIDDLSKVVNLQSLIKLFPLSNTTKQTVLNMISISSINLMVSASVKSSKHLIDLTSTRNRSILIKSDFIPLFSGLLTSSQLKVQLNCLKFYSSISFECLESTRLIFYDNSLLESICLYLSRENKDELQLYSAKCLTNLCRSSLMLKNDSENDQMETDVNEFKNINFNSQLIKFKTLPTLIRLCSTYSSLYRNSSSARNDQTKQNQHKQINMLILIETISTLSYLIELSSDLQQTASCLEQIINIIILNILNGYNNLNSLKLSGSLKNVSNFNTQCYNINKTPSTSLFSLCYLYYNQFTNKGLHFKQNEHQYRLLQPYFKNENSFKSSFTIKSTWFLSNLETTLHKRLISVSFQCLACLASNNEESRRAISDNSDLLNRLIDSIEIKEKNEDFDEIKLLSNLSSKDEVDDFEDLVNYKDESLDDLNEAYFSNCSDATLLRISSLCLLHSLSRSVHQLRTRFLDSKLWCSIIDLIKRLRSKKSPIQKSSLLKKNNSMNNTLVNISNYSNHRLNSDKPLNKNNNDDEEDLLLASEPMETQLDKEEDLSLNEKNLISILIAILANLLIEFSPCKETLINDDIIKILINFIDQKNTSIKVNSIWALMNLAYHSEQKIKQQILAEIKMEKLFQLLTEQDEILVIKTLGLIRNIICNRPHIDYIMYTYGNKIIQAIIMILEGEYQDKMIKEQALCILANIADGNTSKEFIMGNEDLLRKINNFMNHDQTELQVAAVYCVLNLVNSNDEGAYDRQVKLKEIGAHRILQKLLHSNDPILFDKVKTALQQFSTNTQSSTNSLLLA